VLLPFAAISAATSVTLATAKSQSEVQVKISRSNIHRGQRIVARGRVLPAKAGRRVSLQVSRGRGWQTVDAAHTRTRGRFIVRWRPRRLGTYRVRVNFGGDQLSGPGRRSARRAVNVYRRVLVSWYGPGFYGGHLACGGRLTFGTLGVANKRLPCGSKVTLHHRGRTVRVPVIDRGPFSGAREYDLTGATAKRLRFGGVGTILATR
jgi:rare lipoprotein A